MNLRIALCVLVFSVALAGCGGDSPEPFALRLIDGTPTLAFHGYPVKVVRAVAFDKAGSRLLGPLEKPYNHHVAFLGFPVNTHRIDLEFQRGQGHTLATHSVQVASSREFDSDIVFEDVQPTQAPKKTPFTVRIDNNSPYDESEIYVLVLGKNREKTAFYYLKFGADDQNTMTLFGDVASSAMYSTKLSNLRHEGENSYSFQCPRETLVSGRIYLSFGAKLEGVGLNDTMDPLSLQLPSPTGAPDYDKLWEFMELSATIPDDLSAPQIYTLYANTSVVDFYSIGLGMTMEVHDKAPQTVGFVNGARALVLAAFDDAATPVEFRNYVNVGGGISSTQNGVLRVLAPVQAVALDPTGPLSTFLDAAIDAAWIQYANPGTPLNIPDTLPSRAYGYQYTAGPIMGGILTMTCTVAPPTDTVSVGEIYNLSKPTSQIVYECDENTMAPVNDTWKNAGSDGHKRLTSLLLAAINRGVFDTYTDWDQPAKFYTRLDSKYNHYSRIMHDSALDQKVYAFGYDDIYGQDPTLSNELDEVNQVVITIPSFTKP